MMDSEQDILYSSHGPMSMGAFSVAGQPYVIQFIKMQQGGPIQSSTTNAPLTNKTYFFAFAAIDESGIPNDTRFPATAKFELYGIVMNGLVSFVKQHSIDTLYFGCEANDRRKMAVYNRITSRFTQAYDWQLVGEEEIMVQGRKQHMWYCAKNQ